MVVGVAWAALVGCSGTQQAGSAPEGAVTLVIGGRTEGEIEPCG
ncbi:MAG: hypothetical protein AAGA48_20500 [Myxococcota bacterium]